MRNIQARGQFNGNYITVKQIQKTKAKHLFLTGHTFYVQSSNMNPFSLWQPMTTVDPSYEEYTTFEALCNAFEYYNCDNQRGKYLIFFYKIG